MTLTVKPILPRFGAEVSGVDITKPLSVEQAAEIKAVQDKWGVTVWRDTGLDDDTHVAFSRIFGYLEKLPRRPDGRHKFAHPELFDASNLDMDGNIITDPALIVHKRGDRLWHTDSSFMPLRSAYSLLLAHEVPDKDGYTWFADTRSAYDDLPQEMKDRIENLEVIHSLWWSRKLAGSPYSEEEINGRMTARHKLVHVHEGSGRKALYIAAHAMDIVGMDKDEGRALIKELIEWATQPQYVFYVRYAVGDMVIWDNLCSMHKGGEFDETGVRRDMRRTTVREAEVTAPESDEDNPFGKLFSVKSPVSAGSVKAA